MHSSMILAAKNKALQSANEKVKRQQSLKKKYIRKRGTISAAEVQEGLNKPLGVRESENQVTTLVEIQAVNCVPYIYSICRSLQHTACICPERQ